MSNLVLTTRFWNNLHQVHLKQSVINFHQVHLKQSVIVLSVPDEG
jgi:hypothetical protein